MKGIFVGHDHINDYVGNYFGITLGYSANSGFATYGLGGPENHRMRGARVFVVDERTPETFAPAGAGRRLRHQVTPGWEPPAYASLRLVRRAAPFIE